MPKGCFFYLSIFAATVSVGIIALFFYASLPNDIEWAEQPIDLRTCFGFLNV
jgi:hypothetical protein